MWSLASYPCGFQVRPPITLIVSAGGCLSPYVGRCDDLVTCPGLSCLSAQGSLINGGRILFCRQIGFNEECGFFWITAKECNMKSNTKHGQLF